MKYVITETRTGVGWITINRMEAMNAINHQVLTEIKSALDAHIQNKDVGVIVLTGKGEKAFIAGADIKAMGEMDRKAALEYGRLGQDLTLSIEQSPKPVIAAINGFALGGGCEIALACHIRIAADQAKFGQPEVKLGLIPGWGGTQRLPRLVGLGKAVELIISGKLIPAAEALDIGLVNSVVPQRDLMETVGDLCQTILDNGPEAIAVSLTCINQGLNSSLQEGLDQELERFAALFEGTEHKEGISAFIEKRKPKFRD